MTTHPHTLPSVARALPRTLLALALLTTAIHALADAPADAPVILRGNTMGTIYSVTLAHAAVAPAALKDEIDALLESIEQCMSTYRPDSELSRVNAQPSTDWLPVSVALYTVIAGAMQVSHDSAGAFDVTVGPLVRLWGFGPDTRPPRPPDAGALAAARARVGYQRVTLATMPPRLRKTRADVEIDLSAIAKGYAVDRVVELLSRHGIADALVAIAGEIRARGHNADGLPWQVGIAWPDDTRGGVERVLALAPDTALSTSGDYRQYFEYAGRRYSHEIDPATGAPVAHALAAVTVVHTNNLLADAYATALLVLGPERGPALAREKGLNALFLLREQAGFRAVTVGALPTPR